MRDFIIGGGIFLLSTGVILFFLSQHLPPVMLQQIVVLFIVIALALIVSSTQRQVNDFLRGEGKWFALYVATLLIQLLLVMTGGILSPLFILMHLSILGISLVLGFRFGFMFFCFTGILLILQSVLDRRILSQIISDPGSPILYVVSLIVIIPIIQLITRKYKVKETLTTMLEGQVTIGEAIISSVDEMIFIVDTAFQVVSANNAAERLLQKSRSELQDKKIFTILFLRDQKGDLLTGDRLSMMLHEQNQQTVTVSDLRFIAASSAQPKNVILRVKPILDLAGTHTQYTFIISEVASLEKPKVHPDLSETYGRFEALLKHTKDELQKKGLPGLRGDLILAQKLEHDLMTSYFLDEQSTSANTVYVDVASLCRETVKTEQDFADILQVGVQFTLPDFTENEVEPLVQHQYAMPQSQLTGPFFTVRINLQLLSIIIKRLIQISIMLVSSSPEGQVSVSIVRNPVDVLRISITASPATIRNEQKNSLFIHDFGELSEKTNLRYGSGLEGYLVNKAVGLLNISLQTEIEPEQNLLRFTFLLPIKKSLGGPDTRTTSER